VIRTALVTGGSRGVGRGVASSLAVAGFRVFATGRTIRDASMPAGVVGIACDHTDEDQTRAAFERIASEGAALDLLVTSAWGGYERMVEGSLFTWPAPFWEQPRHRWSSMMDAGARAALDCSSHAARLMVPRRSGLIVNISYWAARKHIGNVVYGMAKAATDKLSIDGALELREHGVAMVSLYPGLVRTEAVLDAAKAGWLDLSNSESPEFIGRVIAALAMDPNRMRRSGQVLVAAEVARAYGVVDIDGKSPTPLTLETCS
jgi:NAD(P)-dependent dehydrogenase (short-subunit alcohol dehydrogenase family)